MAATEGDAVVGSRRGGIDPTEAAGQRCRRWRRGFRASSGVPPVTAVAGTVAVQVYMVVQRNRPLRRWGASMAALR